MRHGFVVLSRKMFAGQDPLWESDDPFDRRAAWIDIIALAQWRPFRHHTMNGDIELTRGEFLGSQRYLADRWHWGRQQVRTFLRYLEKSARIVAQRETHSGFVYRLVNYDTYQGDTAAANAPDNPPPNPEPTQSQPKNNHTTKGKKKSSTTSPSAGGEPAHRLTWLTPYADAWDAACGPGSFAAIAGQAAKCLRAAHAIAGSEVLCAHLAQYLLDTGATPQYRSPAAFAKSWQSYAPQRIVDEHGELVGWPTDEGNRGGRPRNFEERTMANIRAVMGADLGAKPENAA